MTFTLFLNTIKERVALYLVRQWILYIYYIMHKSIDHLKRHYRHMIIPIAILTAMYVINLFYPILFLVADDYTISYKPLFYIIRLIVLIAFLYPVLVKILNEELPKDSEVIRTGEGEFILIGEKGDKRVLREIGKI